MNGPEMGLDKADITRLRAVIRYLYQDELKDYESREKPCPGHIYLHVRHLIKVLKRAGWTFDGLNWTHRGGD